MYFYRYYNFYTQVKLNIPVTLESSVGTWALGTEQGIRCYIPASPTCLSFLIYKTEISLDDLQGVLSVRL